MYRYWNWGQWRLCLRARGEYKRQGANGMDEVADAVAMRGISYIGGSSMTMTVLMQVDPTPNAERLKVSRGQGKGSRSVLSCEAVETLLVIGDDGGSDMPTWTWATGDSVRSVACARVFSFYFFKSQV